MMDVIDLPPAMHALMSAVAASCAVANPEAWEVASGGAYGAACWLWGATGTLSVESIAREMDLHQFKQSYTADDPSWLDEWIDPIFCDAWGTLIKAYRARPFPLGGEFARA
ncbi:hypothetical protein ABH944_002986 [Caballeronia udeis]|uniref:Uncharacterized protein n=1 Tax=Caballeronia udeis TaxID=1232866 RepID=A0ABW8MH96_9BURK